MNRLVDAIERRDVDAAGDINASHMTRSRDVRVEIYSTGLQSPSDEIITNAKLLAPYRVEHPQAQAQTS